MSLFSKNLRFLRTSADMGLGVFAKASDVSVDMVELIESGEADPQLETVIKVGELFNVSIDRLLKVDIEQQWASVKGKKIKLLILDVDGVLTDGGMYYSESGDESKKFNAKDGLAIKRLTSKGFNVGIISSGFNTKIIKNRAKLLGIQRVYAGAKPKLEVLEEWCEELKIDISKVAHIGDDLNDLELFNKVGLTACPNDAVPRIKQVSHLIMSSNGGEGCVREYIDNYLEKVIDL